MPNAAQKISRHGWRATLVLSALATLLSSPAAAAPSCVETAPFGEAAGPDIDQGLQERKPPGDGPGTPAVCRRTLGLHGAAAAAAEAAAAAARGGTGTGIRGVGVAAAGVPDRGREEQPSRFAELSASEPPARTELQAGALAGGGCPCAACTGLGRGRESGATEAASTGRHHQQQQQRQQQQQPEHQHREETAGSANPRGNGSKPVPETSAASVAYIVQWADYHPVEEHAALLARELGSHTRCSDTCSPALEGDSSPCSSRGGGGGGCSGETCGRSCWELVERRNAATTEGHPSDFSLVRWVPLPPQPGPNASEETTRPDARVRRAPPAESDPPAVEQERTRRVVSRRTKMGPHSRPDAGILGGRKGATQEPCPGEEYREASGPGHRGESRCGSGEVLGRDAGSGECEDGGPGDGGRGVRERGASCVEAEARRAVGGLRGSRWVKSVYSDKVLTRGISAVPAFHTDPGEREKSSSARSRSSKEENDPSATAGGSPTVDPRGGVLEDTSSGSDQPDGFNDGGTRHSDNRSYSSNHADVDDGNNYLGGQSGVQPGREIDPGADGAAASGGTGAASRRRRRRPKQRRRSPGGTGRHLDAEGDFAAAAAEGGEGGKARLRGSARGEFVDAGLQGKSLHDQGFKGAGVRVAVFDTGLGAGGHDFSNVVERINWTNEDTLEDGVGHGTHVAGVIAGRDPGCSGFAPEADLYVFRVFSSEQVSYTSWFLDAFNYALFLGVDVINLSIGGPDFKDQPFVDKVRELSANGVVVVSAVGNDGPSYGTQHNPADQMDTIGVGAVSADGHGVASFQSRGMTTWELPGGYGRVKPDLIAVGQHVLGPKVGGAAGQCSGLSGTSVASPVVAGAIALLASTVPRNRRRDVINPASIKQVLTESARRVSRAGVFEQGAGVLDVAEASRLLSSYTPRASFLPPELDFTDPYMWPFSRQPLYHGAQPVVFNVTIANGMGVAGSITSLTWTEEESFGAAGGGDVLDVRVEFSEILWPWSGFLAVSLSVSESGRNFQGLVIGELKATIQSEPGPEETQPRSTNAVLPITVSVVRTPDRSRRLLWDQFHSVPYPPVYAPRDYLGDNSDMLDRLGDHPHTNFRTLFDTLLDAGYYVEVLGSDWSCFEAENYGALLLVDPEAELGREEKGKLERDVKERGLSVVLFADWYSHDVMKQVRFVDDNTRMPWEPATGGSNVPAMNEFLLPAFGMALGGTVMDGVVDLPGGKVHLASGNAIARLPPGSLKVSASSLRGVGRKTGDPVDSAGVLHADVPVIGAVDTNRLPSGGRTGAIDGGRVFLFGDSSCADDAAMSISEGNERGDCLWLFKSAVRYACEGFEDPGVFGDADWVFEGVSGGGDDASSTTDRSGTGGFTDGLPLPDRMDAYALREGSRGGAAQEAWRGEETLRSGREEECGRKRFRPVSGAARID